jgi:hypothetical protein
MDTQSAENANPPPSGEHPIDPPPTSKASENIPPSNALQTTAQQLTDRALVFLSNASNETLGACLVGIGATTYFVLGRVGLVLMGVVGGVVLHATWEGNTQEASKSVEEKRRKETGLDVVHRVLDWRTQRSETAREDEEDDAASSMKVDVFSKKALDFTGFRPETEEALNEFTDAVIRDYVKYELQLRRGVYLLTRHVGGGTRQSCHPRCNFQTHVGIHSSPFSFQYLVISPESDRRTPSLISLPTHPQSSSSSSTN